MQFAIENHLKRGFLFRNTVLRSKKYLIKYFIDKDTADFLNVFGEVLDKSESVSQGIITAEQFNRFKKGFFVSLEKYCVKERVPDRRCEFNCHCQFMELVPKLISQAKYFDMEKELEGELGKYNSAYKNWVKIEID
jgi:hypothetical protein